MPHRYVLLLALLLVASMTYADKKGGKKQTKSNSSYYELPVPDALPSIAKADKPQPVIREAVLQTRRSYAVGTMQGIDVSHYQGNIAWDQVARDANVRFVYIKATESSGYVDKCYARNMYGAKMAGIPVGVYHFFSPSTSALTQFENFRSNVNPRDNDLIPVVDVEKRGKKPLAQFHRELQQFLDAVERMYGVKPIIYTGVNFYASYLAGRFKQYRFMVARYAEEFPGLCEEVPIVLWQYSCTGSVRGIHGNVDCSVFMDRYTLSDILLPNSRVAGK